MAGYGAVTFQLCTEPVLKASNSTYYRNGSLIYLWVGFSLCKKRSLRVKYLIYYVIQIYSAQSFQVGILICSFAKVRHCLLISVIKWVGFK